MTEISDDRSRWADVERERSTDRPTDGRTPRTALDELGEHAMTHGDEDLYEGDGPPRRRITGGQGSEDSRRREPATPRRSRAAERDRAERGEIRVSRRDQPALRGGVAVASFADAMDLDGAFGAPASRPRSREIVLTGRSRTDVDDELADDRYYDDEHGYADDGEPTVDRRHAVQRGYADGGRRRGAYAEAPVAHADAADTDADPRRTVRIASSSGVSTAVAERRALREIESRRRGSVAERSAHRPDRIAMWAVLLGVFLVIIAASSSPGIS